MTNPTWCLLLAMTLGATQIDARMELTEEQRPSQNNMEEPPPFIPFLSSGSPNIIIISNFSPKLTKVSL